MIKINAQRKCTHSSSSFLIGLSSPTVSSIVVSYPAMKRFYDASMKRERERIVTTDNNNLKYAMAKRDAFKRA